MHYINIYQVKSVPGTVYLTSWLINWHLHSLFLPRVTENGRESKQRRLQTESICLLWIFAWTSPIINRSEMNHRISCKVFFNIEFNWEGCQELFDELDRNWSLWMVFSERGTFFPSWCGMKSKEVLWLKHFDFKD